ncbi:HD domain-containing phosphohydrolase [Granulosicoccus antarcticus]|uniref:3'3'-cGAMP-specific phosphodiesterase 1 n=1 Tax=Granulosicoccus antarcticus IMCC3135 TaxID=1192854 RepID=A0A2Z2P026_9GAMM|nr:HD domain-containing phosphohydrolase [Granulosicoccus antarcticus]ASJ72734.1 3'3'-cGAMP-specific phosphodiesterase 1 [Granulosicoccus antarcticus IMCC3135]
MRVPSLRLWLPGKLRLRQPWARESASRRSLRVNIGVAFSLLIFVLGSGLITFSHERHRRIALVTASELFERSTAQLAADISSLYGPAETLVNLTATLANELPILVTDRDLLLVHFAAALDDHPNVEAVFVGEGDGSFFLLRSIKDSPDSSGLDTVVPAGTRYQVESVERGQGEGAQYEHVFLGKDLEWLGANEAFITGYDPRSRDWYRLASRSSELLHTDFHTFFTTRETGTTIARRIGETKSVVGVDITLEILSAALGKLSTSATGEIIVFTEDGRLLGSDKPDRMGGTGKLRPSGSSPRIADFDEPILDELFHRFVEGDRDASLMLNAAGQSWFASIRPVRFGSNRESAFMAIAVPEKEMLSALERVRLQSAAFALVALALSVLFAWYLSTSISKSTAQLAAETREMSRLRFHSPITVRSRIAEIDALARSMAVLKAALQRFTRVAVSLSAEEGSDGVARVLLAEAKAASRAQVARLFLVSDDEKWLVAFEPDDAIEEADVDVRAGGSASIGRARIALESTDWQGVSVPPEVFALNAGRTVIDGVDVEPRGAESSVQADARLLLVPLKADDERAIGVLQLSVSPAGGASLQVDEENVRFLELLAASAAVAIRNRQLIEAQQATFESLIRLLAAAIDAKSPYTGRHCERVPVLTERLASAASASEAPAFRNFHLDEHRARELHVASWLHDCGKVTTPEHLVDKATKLETVYNRIHEIRTRFEVLWRDAEIDYLRAVDGLPGGERESLSAELERRRIELRADFSFIASCNIGSEGMDEESVERIRAIGRQAWMRHFDNTLGISQAELKRMRNHGSASLPATEQLLCDRPEHRIEWHAQPDPAERERHGFTAPVPENEYDHGELHNLTIRYGTLTAEERHKINDHVNQTILMLDSVSFPKNLKRVPAIAGSHHEKLDGSGYPRGLGAQELGIEERIMTIADIFEALTAPDRPYKRAKTLGESLLIMRDMGEQGLIDAELLELFVESGIPQEYARENLAAVQIDIPISVRPAVNPIGERINDER